MQKHTADFLDEGTTEAFYRRLKPEGKRLILSIDRGGDDLPLRLAVDQVIQDRS